jgi:hypothetical protein
MHGRLRRQLLLLLLLFFFESVIPSLVAIDDLALWGVAGRMLKMMVLA